MGIMMAQYNKITREEKALVTNSWSRIRSDLTKCGANLFIILFTDFPKMGAYFPFKGPNEDSFERHINIFMGELDKLVRSIEDPEEIAGLLTDNARRHVTRNIPKEDYMKFKLGTLKMLRSQLGSQFKKEMEQAWEKALSLTFNFICETSSNIKKGK